MKPAFERTSSNHSDRSDGFTFVETASRDASPSRISAGSSYIPINEAEYTLENSDNFLNDCETEDEDVVNSAVPSMERSVSYDSAKHVAVGPALAIETKDEVEVKEQSQMVEPSLVVSSSLYMEHSVDRSTTMVNTDNSKIDNSDNSNIDNTDTSKIDNTDTSIDNISGNSDKIEHTHMYNLINDEEEQTYPHIDTHTNPSITAPSTHDVAPSFDEVSMVLDESNVVIHVNNNNNENTPEDVLLPSNAPDHGYAEVTDDLESSSSNYAVYQDIDTRNDFEDNAAYLQTNSPMYGKSNVDINNPDYIYKPSSTTLDIPTQIENTDVNTNNTDVNTNNTDVNTYNTDVNTNNTDVNTTSSSSKHNYNSTYAYIQSKKSAEHVNTCHPYGGHPAHPQPTHPYGTHHDVQDPAPHESIITNAMLHNRYTYDHIPEPTGYHAPTHTYYPGQKYERNPNFAPSHSTAAYVAQHQKYVATSEELLPHTPPAGDRVEVPVTVHSTVQYNYEQGPPPNHVQQHSHHHHHHHRHSRYSLNPERFIPLVTGVALNIVGTATNFFQGARERHRDRRARRNAQDPHYIP